LPASHNSFKATLEKPIRRFDSDRTHYLSKSYSEAQTRVDFISPFFKALGWDVEHEAFERSIGNKKSWSILLSSAPALSI